MPSLQPEMGKNRVFVVIAIFFDRDLGDHIVCLDVVMSFLLLFACVWLEGRCISLSIQPDISYAQKWKFYKVHPIWVLHLEYELNLQHCNQQGYGSLGRTLWVFGAQPQSGCYVSKLRRQSERLSP